MPDQDREVCLETVITALQDAYPDTAEDMTFDYLELENYTGQYFAGHINARCTPSVARGITSEPTEETVNWSTQQAVTNGFHTGDATASRRDSLAASMGAGESQDAEGSGDAEDDESEDVDMDAVNA